MLCLVLLVILLTDRTRTALVTNPPTFADRLGKLYEKLEKFTYSPIKRPSYSLYEKLDHLNSLVPDKQFADDDEDEMLSALKMWGVHMSNEKLEGIAQEMQNIKDEKSETNDDYGDDLNDDEMDQEISDDYANDGEDSEIIDEEPSTSRPVLGVTPSAFTRLDNYRHTVVSAVDPIAATNERPRILNDIYQTPEEERKIRKAALSKIQEMVKSTKCLTPQPRWLSVRKLAPAADTVYMPPCVQLHRCAPDSGCCLSGEEVCAPVDGTYVALPFLLNKVDGELIPARMMFFNHTRCACVSRSTLETTTRTKIDRNVVPDVQERDKQNDWEGVVRAPTEEPVLELTAPPQLLRCTCPVLFRSHVSDGVCTCTCDWPETSRRRDCLSLARGREHFGLRDRVCIERGDCNKPACASGAYEVSAGKCPHRFKRQSRRRPRYHVSD